MAPFDAEVDPVAQVKVIVAELKAYDTALYKKPRWLVLNKLDMVPVEDRERRVADVVKRLRWKGPVFAVSALTRSGLDPLVQAAYRHVHESRHPTEAAVDPRFEAAVATPAAIPRATAAV
jgi:GTP-binding protein